MVFFRVGGRFLPLLLERTVLSSSHVRGLIFMNCPHTRGFIPGLPVLSSSPVPVLCQALTAVVTAARRGLKSERKMPPGSFFFLRVFLAVQGRQLLQNIIRNILEIFL